MSTLKHVMNHRSVKRINNDAGTSALSRSERCNVTERADGSTADWWQLITADGGSTVAHFYMCFFFKFSPMIDTSLAALLEQGGEGGRGGVGGRRWQASSSSSARLMRGFGEWKYILAIYTGSTCALVLRNSSLQIPWLFKNTGRLRLTPERGIKAQSNHPTCKNPKQSRCFIFVP